MIIAACSIQARAETITFSFSGPVHESSGIAPMSPGDLLTGSMTFDTTQLVTTEESPGARRFDGPVDLQLSFRRPSGETVAEYALPHGLVDLVVNNDVPDDAFRPIVRDSDNPTFTFGFFFTDRSGTTFASTDFPRTLNLASFDESRLFFGNFWNRLDRPAVGTFTGAVTSLNGITVPDDQPPSATPEPASMFLVGTALAGMGMRRFRRRRTA